MATGQFYPTSLTFDAVASAEVRAQDIGADRRDAISVSNIVSYQELADIVNEFSGGNLVYNSTAKYPTDNKVGTEIIANRTQAVVDLNSAIDDFNTIKGNWDTNYAALNTAKEKAGSAALTGNSHFNLQSKLEKINRELNRLNDDLARVAANTAGGWFSTPSRYPSGQNRITNTANGA